MRENYKEIDCRYYMQFHSLRTTCDYGIPTTTKEVIYHHARDRDETTRQGASQH